MYADAERNAGEMNENSVKLLKTCPKLIGQRVWGDWLIEI